MKTSIALLTLLTTLATAAVLPSPPFKLKNMVPAGPLPTLRACPVSTVQQPTAPTPLPTPGAGNVLSLIAVGRGTQNYTCADSTAASVPAANGALAALYDGSCIARSSPAVLAAVTTAVQKITVDQMPVQLAAAGHHYFADATTPTFAMDVNGLGTAFLKKGSASAAPGAANGDVPWLYLKTPTQGGPGSVSEIYRLNTANGSPPKTCEGQPAAFEVQYSAEYWFYTTPSA